MGDLELLKKALPDSRSTARRGEIRTPLGNASPIYCANCGAFAGYTFVNTEFMFYLCEGCDHHGTGLDLPIVDEATVQTATGGS
jgi:hypothetical protein